jgi:hypothetical protein
MTKRINMKVNTAVAGEAGAGVMTSDGNPWTVADGLAYELINRGLATLVDAEPPLWGGGIVGGVLDFRRFTPPIDGVTDCTQKWLDACTEARGLGVPLLLPPHPIVVAQTAALNKIFGTPGKSKIILAPDFTKTGFGNQFCLLSETFSQAYNDTTAAEVAYYGFDIETSPNVGRSILGLANVRRGLIDRVNIRANRVNNGPGGKPIAVDSLIDLYACVKNVTIRRSLLENITGAWGVTRVSEGGGGAIWIRNLRSAAGNASDNVTEGNVVENCRIRHQTSDEALAIFGVRGPTRDNVVRNNKIYGLDSTDAYHSGLVSCFPLDDGSGAGLGSTAAVYDNLFESNRIESRSFLYNVFRIGNTADANRLCFNNRSRGNTIVAYRSSDAATGPKAIWVAAGSVGSDPDIASKAMRCIEGTVAVAYPGVNSGNDSVDDSVDCQGLAQTNAAFSGFQSVVNPTIKQNCFTGLESCSLVDGGRIQAYGRTVYNCGTVRGGWHKVDGPVGNYLAQWDLNFSFKATLEGVQFVSAGRFVSIGALVPAGTTIQISNCSGSVADAAGAAIINNANAAATVKAHLNVVTGAMSAPSSGTGTTTRSLNTWAGVPD